MKTCIICKISKPLENFHKNSRAKDLKCNKCKLCSIAYKKEWDQKNKQSLKNYLHQYHKDNIIRIKIVKRKYYLNNKERTIDKYKKWVENNREKHNTRTRKWSKLNPHSYRNSVAKRTAAKLKRTPKWANLKAIKKFYRNCPEGYEVDHIIPLQGKNVCGLHVEYNLQYLTKIENRKKSNKF